ncbi:MAG: hypothetical protein AMXMBFR59_12670 [Rhodanobacteraceae bacterium]
MSTSPAIPLAEYVRGTDFGEVGIDDVRKEQGELVGEAAAQLPLTKLLIALSASGNLFLPDSDQLRFVNSSSKAAAYFSRVGERTPTGASTPRTYAFEKDPAHDDRVDDLLRMLNNCKDLQLREGQFPEVKVATLNGYIWRKEVSRTYSRNGMVRHDIVGWNAAGTVSPTQPVVAIEVINTHWPEMRALEDVIAHSHACSFVVLFDFVGAKQKLMKFFGGADPFLKGIMYVANGSVQKLGKPYFIADRRNPSEQKILDQPIELCREAAVLIQAAR